MVHILAASSLHYSVKSGQHSEKKELLTKTATVKGISFNPNTRNGLKDAQNHVQGPIEHKEQFLNYVKSSNKLINCKY